MSLWFGALHMNLDPMSKTAIFFGHFDPITKDFIKLVKSATKAADEVIIFVLHQEEEPERVNELHKIIKDLKVSIRPVKIKEGEVAMFFDKTGAKTSET